MSTGSQNMTLYETIYQYAQKNKFIVAAYSLVIIVSIVLYNYINLASKDAKAFTRNFTYNIIVIIFPIVLILGLLLYATYEKQIPLMFYGIVGVLFIIFIVFYFIKSTLSKYIFNKYLLFIVMGAITLVALAIITTMFSSNLKQMTGWKGFIINLIFYIPCLIRDGIKHIVKEYNSTPITLLILFVFEIFLIIMYFFLIPLLYEKSYPAKTIILEDPVMLNMETQLTNKFPVKLKTNSNFAMSFWVFLNPGPSTKFGYSEETSIFNYYYTDTVSKKNIPHFQLAYDNHKHDGMYATTNEFVMYVGDKSNKDNKLTISLPLQKWHNFVINFVSIDIPVNENTTNDVPKDTKSTPSVKRQYSTDIFINGTLERSHTFLSDEQPQFNYNDALTISSDINDMNSNKTINDNGLYGSVCNIVHYKTPLSKMAIIHNYNLLTIQNPPIG
jgi:hypothetical protein